MTFIIMIFVLIGAGVAQSHAPEWAFFGQAKFPFLLAVVFYYALNREIHFLLISGFLAGLLQDSLSPIPLGISAVCFCVLGLVAARLRRMVITDSVLTYIIFGGLGGTVATVCLYLMLKTGNYIVGYPGWVARKAIGTGILGMFCAPLIYYIVGWLDRIVGNVYLGESIDGIE